MTAEERRWKKAADALTTEQVGIIWRWWFRYYLARLTPSRRVSK